MMLVHAGHTKNWPGGRSSVCGLPGWSTFGLAEVCGTFMPPGSIRQLRELPQACTIMLSARGREACLLEKVLQDAGLWHHRRCQAKRSSKG